MRAPILTLYAVAIYAFLHLPLVILGVFSFNRSKFTHWEGFSLRWYEAALRDRTLLESAWNSLLIASFATLLSTAIGTLAAHAIWKRSAPWLSTSLYVSLVTPEIVTGVSLLALFQIVFRVLHLQLGMHTVVLAHVSFCLVYVVMVVLARLRTIDASYEEAAQDLGATPWQAFWQVTLPMLRPGIVAAALLAFTTSLDDYVITSLVAGVDSETLPMIIYGMARRGVNPAVNAISTLIVFGLGVLIVISQRLEHKA
ncbi:ABC transporter permease [Bryobacter aggregatus]|uniref:ABC transporter permease n=1 Tax=Bryobacter aggregatus TaxID=360054 RepID=UPI0004E1BD2D|nr:ABC transporter permease [Bryobacter aggregatus]